jgi:hypothetical protein
MRTATRQGPPGRQTEFNFDFVHDHFNVGHSRLRAPASALSKEAKDDCEFQTGFRLVFGIELPQVLSIVLQVIELGQALGEGAQCHNFRMSAHNLDPFHRSKTPLKFESEGLAANFEFSASPSLFVPPYESRGRHD